MVTGASTADLSVVLVDARKGVSEQTRRHAYIASLLRIPHVVVCVNKMDLVDYDEAVFEQIVDELTDWTARLDIADVTFIPISALHGDNVVDRSTEMPWYDGPPLLYHLEHVVIAPDRNLAEVRFPVQWVVRPNSDEHHDYRGYAGTVAGGVLHPGDEVLVLPERPAHRRSTAIDTFDGPVETAFPTMSVTVRVAGRRRHLARRHDRRGRRSARGRARARRDGLLDGPGAAAAGRAPRDQAHDAHHPRPDRGARLPGRGQHARPRARRRARAQRDRPGSAPEPARR